MMMTVSLAYTPGGLLGGKGPIARAARKPGLSRTWYPLRDSFTAMSRNPCSRPTHDAFPGQRACCRLGSFLVLILVSETKPPQWQMDKSLPCARWRMQFATDFI